MRHRYLMEHRKVVFYNLLTSGKLGYHLVETENTALDMFERIMTQMAEKQGVTEQLKADNQMLWVQRMNNIRSAVDEIVLNDLIYV